ncbi:hypothetical protein FRACYDRAFT_246417 [Fragilariopsis cylindrus CCMP1102]|uniref:Uncharacterized protein n=1 Tax=Fragilariopsis cylindrus CCMP1102 TaxID=635003 RepID=A0A1E7EZC2_9STRA|nr:hypothetical protein FRACYDRAFT_246417 [Fragilariopsis cylindrus CCMP1102]|eukprot:OEU11302.1 hypothetical protein FRACYDRAFT_246417 [Fragilariopsis cylindrus CCMP1102]
MYRVDTWTGLWGARYVIFRLEGGKGCDTALGHGKMAHLGGIPVMGAVSSQIFLQCVHFGPFYVYSIVPHPTTPPIWQMFQVFLFMNGTFGLGNITCWPKCTVCVLEARISKMNFIPQPQEQKVVGGKLNVLVHYVDISAISLFDVVPYNPFK